MQASAGTYLFVRDRLACEVEVRAAGRNTQTFAEILAETPFLDGDRCSFLVDHGVRHQRECHNDRHSCSAAPSSRKASSLNAPCGLFGLIKCVGVPLQLEVLFFADCLSR